MAQLLKVTPAKVIEFPCVLYTSQTAHITLENVSNSSVAFKIKTTAPKNYLVRPSTGVVEPHGDQKVQIILQPLKNEPESSVDRFSIQATALESNESSLLEKDLWKTIDKSRIQDHRLVVMFTEAASGETAFAAPDGGAAEETARTSSGIGTTPMSGAARTPNDPTELRAKYEELVSYCMAVEKQKAALQRELDNLKQAAPGSVTKGDGARAVAVHSGFELWHVVAVVIIVLIIVKMVRLI